MKTNDFQKNYVNHYLLLEKDFEETKQYVTIAEDNFEASGTNSLHNGSGTS